MSVDALQKFYDELNMLKQLGLTIEDIQ